jgi:hypothetical protein
MESNTVIFLISGLISLYLLYSLLGWCQAHCSTAKTIKAKKSNGHDRAAAREEAWFADVPVTHWHA